jgi:hypothetical protein
MTLEGKSGKSAKKSTSNRSQKSHKRFCYLFVWPSHTLIRDGLQLLTISLDVHVCGNPHAVDQEFKLLHIAVHVVTGV